MLSGAPPRGLPGTTIERVALQQANTGRPLDDVVVYAHDVSGGKAVLEIQVKRDITFAPADPIFRKVVGQIVKASRHADFFAIRYELAIATTKGSRKIGGAYQDVLMLARQIGDAATFVAQIGLAGAANDDMRAFVRTFRFDHRFGRRWCAIVETICTQVPPAADAQLPIRATLDGIVAALVGLGIPQASRLEDALARS